MMSIVCLPSTLEYLKSKANFISSLLTFYFVLEYELPNTLATDVKNWLFGKDPDAGQDWRQEEKGTTEDKMVGWYHRLDGHEFE